MTGVYDYMAVTTDYVCYLLIDCVNYFLHFYK
uniref:Uncharacterized protein n=1 Tax=Anguilla anguilla TaxID=7936 RepID=A0A0E9SZX7_ANGAN